MAALSVGQVARRAGVGVEPVRFYERQGLLAEPARKASGYRQYGDEAVAALRFIRRAELLGFTLKEIKGLLALRLDGGATRSAVREQATAKIPTSRTRSATSAHADRPQGVDRRLPRQRPDRRLPHPRRPERPGRRGTAHPGRGGVTITETRCKTNLNCGSCVAAVAPHLNGEGRIRQWSVDTRNPDKVLTVEGDGVGADAVGRLVAAAGFRVLGEVAPPKDLSANGTATAE